MIKKKEKTKSTYLINEKIHSLNIYIFLGFNLTLVSILGFIWFNSSVKDIV